MDAMAKGNEIVVIRVTVELPPRLHGADDQVRNIVSTIFEDDSYNMELIIESGNELRVHVLIPRLSNPDETSFFEHDNIASALVKQRLMMTL